MQSAADVINPLVLPPPEPASGDPGGDAPFPQGRWFAVPNAGDRIRYPMTPGAAAGAVWVTLDSMADTDWFLTCQLLLQSGGRTLWSATISSLAACQTRWVTRLPSR
jgi:hypothetical protein